VTTDQTDPRAIIDRWLDAVNALDFAAAVALLSDDFVSLYPQSGEVIRGRSNMKAIFDNYPGGLIERNVDRTTTTVIGADQWAMTPTFTLVRVSGTGTARTAILKSLYPDGSTVYFAPAFDPPAWRAKWVEPPNENAATRR